MFNYIDHIALVFSNIDPAMNQFESAFEVQPIGMNSDSHRKRHNIVAAFYQADINVIEIMAPLADDTWAAEHLKSAGPGFFHIAYAVNDIDDAIASVQERGINTMTERPQSGFSGLIVTLDPDDTLVPTQLVEPD